MKPTTIAEIEIAMRPFSERVALTMGRGVVTIERTFDLAHAVGNPQDRLKVVHVAGTSGKTSTSYFIAALLGAADKKVGLTVSPHISSITERTQINLEQLNEEKYVQYFNDFMQLVASSGIEPTYFEFTMVFSLWVFDKEHVDYAVVETGFGGLFDSSNICRRADKVCVITDIGFDHMHILGNTLPEIAAQKAGIIAKGNLVCMYEQAADVMRSVLKAVRTQEADLRFAPKRAEKTYQDRNFALAEFVYSELADKDKLAPLDDHARTVARQTHIPGRLEKLQVGDTTFLLDGAHNEQKMRTLFASLETDYPKKKWPIILAMKADKDIAAVADIVAGHALEIVSSEFLRGQDLPAHSLDAGELDRYFNDQKFSHSAIPKLSNAIEYFVERGEELVLLTGSFYALAQARAWLIAEKGGIVKE